MQLIYGTTIKETLRNVAPKTIAVAYVGIDWAEYIDPAILEEIVLSPTLGSNPYAVEQIARALGWDRVHFLENLHSKVYLGASQAAVGSFNLTANGLSASGLAEAGLVLSDANMMDELRVLVSEYKRDAMAAYPTTESKLVRLAALRTQWDRAVSNATIRNDSMKRDLHSYRPAVDTDVYVCCVWGEMEYSGEVTSPATIRDSVSFLERDAIAPDRWILCWYARSDGKPDDRRKPYWLHIDEVVPLGAQHAHYTKLAIERSDRVRPGVPFELTAKTTEALHAVLRSEEFPELLGNIDPWSVDDTLQRLPAFFDAVGAWLDKQSEDAKARQSDATHAAGKPDVRQLFKSRILEAMNLAIRNRYVTQSIDGMLTDTHPVELAKRLVRGTKLKPGLTNLARANALHLSFESIMLEPQFESLFSRHDLDYARWNLQEVDASYRPPVGNR